MFKPATRPIRKSPRPRSGAKSRCKRSRRWIIAAVLFLMLVTLVVARLLLPRALQQYVNHELARNPLYTGTVGTVQVHLLRGAYSIHEIKISKTIGQIPVPFFSAKRLDLAVQWNALVHGRVVGRMLIEEPELNFVDGPTESESQTGIETPWLEMVQQLFPFTINQAIVRNGSIHLRAFEETAPVDVYLSEIEGIIDNLGNIRNESNPLVSTVQANGLVMDQAKFEFQMVLDPFSYRPTFRLATRILGLDVTTINDLAMAYGKWDFRHGWFDFVLEIDAKEGHFTGYAKPLFRNIEIFTLKEDLLRDNPIQIFWEALVGATVKILENPSRDQFGTLIPFSGDLSGKTNADLLATIGNILRNAFVRAYLPALEDQQAPLDGIQFEPPQFTESLASGVFP